MKNESKCEQFQNLIVMKANSPLEVEQNNALDEHIKGCAACKKCQEILNTSLAFFKEIETPLANIAIPDPSRQNYSLVQTVMTILSWRLPVYKALTASAILVLLTMGLFMFKGTPAPDMTRHEISSISYAEDDFSRKNDTCYASTGSLFSNIP